MAEVPEPVADRLYALPPRRFVAERDAAAAQARADGDAGTARAIAGLRRPTVAAWLVNLLALRRPDAMAELAELADGLQAAQRDLHGGTLRDLTAQRRRIVSALVTTARSLAREEDPELPSALPAGEVESTLTAALADPEVAAQVRAGRLQRSVAYTGFGEPGGVSQRAPAPAAELARAREAVTAAETELRRAGGVRQSAEEELAAVDDELARLRARRSDVAAQLADAEQAERSAAQELERARRLTTAGRGERDAAGRGERDE